VYTFAKQNYFFAVSKIRPYTINTKARKSKIEHQKRNNGRSIYCIYKHVNGIRGIFAQK
jgi:hypothetical protein